MRIGLTGCTGTVAPALVDPWKSETRQSIALFCVPVLLRMRYIP
jgi:hypothetical protein